MELLNVMTRVASDERRKQRLDFLAAFLKDAEAPDLKANPKMFEVTHAGFMFDRLAVQDLAARNIAYILGIPDWPDKKWTPARWEKLRDNVKQRLKK